jgi:uncharacterized protein (TIGR04222 family)
VNPFDLRGPQFLAFYAALCAVTLGVLWILNRRSGRGEIAPRIDDPYPLAVLADGKARAVRVAMLSLLDRRLLKAKEGKLQALAKPDLARRPIEKALLDAYATESPASDAFLVSRVREAASAIEDDLTRAGLLTDEQAKGLGQRRVKIAIALLAVVAVVKIVVALSRGHTNVGFLILMGTAALFVARSVGASRHRTPKGDEALALAERHFARLKTAAAGLAPGGETNEIALAAALFGMGVLSPLAKDLLVEARIARTSSSGGSSCGSSFSSSCSTGSSCSSSSCGGGGGCGGCGS